MYTHIYIHVCTHMHMISVQTAGKVRGTQAEEVNVHTHIYTCMYMISDGKHMP